MGGSIFLKRGNELVEMREAPYELEDVLQRLLADHPNLLAGEQIDADNPRRWLLIMREMGVPSKDQGSAQWSLDHLFLDQDGIPTLVEVKRGSDTRIRREVVGQMLDYAANGVAYWPVEEIVAKFETRCERNQQDGDVVLQDFLGAERDPSSFWDAVKTNLQAGKIRMVFVADEIPPELLRVVQFLNQQMDPAEVLALEVRQYAGEGHTTLVPRVVGQRMKPGSTPPTMWDESSFFEKLQATSPAGAPVARALYDWAKSEMPSITWGKGSHYGSFTPGLTWNETKYQFFRVYTKGDIEMQFGYLETRPPFDETNRLHDFRRRLSAVRGVNVPDEQKYPGVALAALRDKEALDAFLQVLDWAVQEIKAS